MASSYNQEFSGFVRNQDCTSSLQSLRQLIERIDARIDPNSFVEAVTSAFLETRDDAQCSSMEQRFREEPSFQLFKNALERAGGRGLQHITVLGCGEGFAGESADFATGVVQEVLQREGSQTITRLNLSPTALRQFEKGNCEQQNLTAHGGAELVVVHSMLHYILDITPVFSLIRRLLKTTGGVIVAHEPNARFWQNTACQSALADFHKSRRPRPLRRYLNAALTIARCKNGTPQSATVWDRVNLRLKQQFGLKGALAENEIRRIVDIHRPEAVPGNFRIGLNGFDVDELSRTYLPDFHLEWVATTGHLGYFSANNLTPAWRRRQSLLEAMHPLAGSVFTAYWHRN